MHQSPISGWSLYVTNTLGLSSPQIYVRSIFISNYLEYIQTYPNSSGTKIRNETSSCSDINSAALIVGALYKRRQAVIKCNGQLWRTVICTTGAHVCVGCVGIIDPCSTCQSQTRVLASTVPVADACKIRKIKMAYSSLFGVIFGEKILYPEFLSNLNITARSTSILVGAKDLA